MNELQVSFTVDWIAATFTKESGFGFVHSLTGYGAMKGVSTHGTKGYDQGYEYENGVRVSWHSTREEMGVHVVLSGSCLRKLYGQELHWKDLFVRVAEKGGRTSRVDLAFDLKGSKLTSELLDKSALKPYKGKGRTPGFVKLWSEGGGWTTYVGSRTSEKFLRIYDKAKEQKDYESDYVRVELETKGEVAHAVGWNFARENMDVCVQMARGLLLGVADFAIPAWERAFSGGVVGASFPQGKDKDTFGWLIKQCVPALARQIAMRPGEPVLDQFWDALREELTKHGISSEGSTADTQ